MITEKEISDMADILIRCISGNTKEGIKQSFVNGINHLLDKAALQPVTGDVNYHSVVCKEHEWIKSEFYNTLDNSVLYSTVCRKCGVLKSDTSAALQNKGELKTKPSIQGVIAETLIVDAKFCPKCNPHGWGNNMVQYLPTVQKCNVCGYEHSLFQKDDISAEDENKIRGEIFKIVHRINKVDVVVDEIYKLYASTVNERKDSNKVEFYRKETSKLRTYVFDNKIGLPNQSIFDAIIEEVERLKYVVNERKDSAGSEAISFAKWIHGNYAPTHSLKWIKRNIGGKEFYAEDLYKIFLESQPKQKED